jgi:hypothetical protein
MSHKGETAMYKHKLFILIVLVAFATLSWSPALANSPALAGSPAAAQVAKLVITNKTADSLSIRLTGPKNQTLLVPRGKTIVELPPGKYQYSYKACGADKSGTLDLKKSGKLNITACQMVKIKVFNLTNHNMYLRLTGPVNYNFTLAPGISNIRVVKGTYNLSLTGCGGPPDTGTEIFKGNIKLTVWCDN